MQYSSSFFYVSLLALLIVVLQSYGQETHGKIRGDVTVHEHHTQRRPFVRSRILTIYPIQYGYNQSFSDRSLKVQRRKKSGRFRATRPTSCFPIEGDPDLAYEDKSFRRVIRIRSGSVGYRRLATPQWFRPIHKSELNRKSGDIFGSIILLTNHTLLIDSNLIDKDEFVRDQRYKLYPFHHPDEEIEDRWISYKSFHTIGNSSIDVFFVSELPSGFHYFTARSSDASLAEFPIEWRVNYNRHGDKRNGYPEDKYRRPDLGCFGFMYTKMRMGDEEVLVNTEYPVSIVEYQEGERTTVYSNDGTYSYQPYSTLVGEFNSGSPVFCGYEGRLRYFARQFNETTKKLIPIHDVANDIKLADKHVDRSFRSYDQIVSMLDRRDRDENEPGWMPNNEPPWWFRQVYRTTPTLVQGRTSWFAGYMIVLSREYFLIPDYVASVALGTSSGHQWTYYGNFSSPTRLVNSFGNQSAPLSAEDSSNWPEPVAGFKGTDMMLYKNPAGNPGWRENGWPKIKKRKGYSQSNCDYLSFQLVGTESEPDIRLASKTPVFVIPNSCSKYYCFIIFETGKEPSSFQHMNPVMCDGYPALLVLDTPTLSLGGVRLALRIEYIAHRLRMINPKLYKDIVDEPLDEQGGSNELLPTRKIEPSDRWPPSWFGVMLHSHPNRGPLSGFAGSLVIVSPNKFIAADYVVNNALPPRKSTLFQMNSTYEPLTRWISRDERGLSPVVWNGAHRKHSGEELNLKDDYYPELERHLEDVDMVLMNWKRGFGRVKLPTFIDFKPGQQISDLDDCNLYSYLLTSSDGLMFVEVPINIEKCDDNYCYGPIDIRYAGELDLSKGVHAGAPVVCNSTTSQPNQANRSLTFYNAPYPDHLSRAKFRIIRQALIHNRLTDNKVETNVTAPDWYRILLSRDIIPPYPQSPTMLAQVIVLNDPFFIGLEKDIYEALEISATHGNTTWSVFQTLEQPTPSAFEIINVDEKMAPGDLPLKRISLRDTGLAVFHRKAGYELLGGGIHKLSSNISKGQESRSDCWVYTYRRELKSDMNVTYSLHKSKVSIKHCVDGFCDTKPYQGLFREGAPIVCGGFLSYIYQRQQSNTRPRAVQISWIYEQMKELDDDFSKLKEFQRLIPKDRIQFYIKNHEWYDYVLPYYETTKHFEQPATVKPDSKDKVEQENVFTSIWKWITDNVKIG